MKLRVLLADDHAAIRQALRMSLEPYADIEVVGEADRGSVAAAMACQMEPDVVVMDISMPGTDGIEATKEIMDACPKVKVIGLSMHQDPKLLHAMVEAGAVALHLKDASVEELVEKIRRTLA